MEWFLFLRLSGIEFLQDRQGFQFGEIRYVQPIVSVEHLKDSHALTARETEKVHDRIVHAEKLGQRSRLLLLQEVGMGRLTVAVSAREEVEVTVGALQVGIDANESAEVHEKCQMKIGYSR